MKKECDEAWPGDCLWIPAKYLHYVRSWGRNVGVSWMIQDNERFDPTVCTPEPSEALPLAAFDILWNFPGERGEPEHNQIKMGYPNWARMRRQLAMGISGRPLSMSAFRRWYEQRGGNPQHAIAFFKLLAGEDHLLQDRELYSADGHRMFRRLLAGDEDHERAEEEDDGEDDATDHETDL